MSILLKNCSYVAPISANFEILNDIDIFIDGPEIKDIGKNLEYTADEIISGTGKVVLPGFINTHHHLYQTFTRAIPRMQDVKLFDWLKGLYEIWREFNAEDFYESALVGMAELILTGCTTTTDHLYLFPENQPGTLIDETIRAAGVAGIRFVPTRGSMSLGKTKGGLPPDDVVQEENVIIADSLRLIEKYHNKNKFSMLQIALAPCSPFSITSDLLRETIKLARNYGVLCHTHLAETLDEQQFCLDMVGKRPLEYMESLGWLGPDVWFAHAVHLTSSEIDILAETRTSVSHCPSSNMRLGSGIAKIPEMLKKGVTVSLAVDGSASNDSSDMLGEMRTALLLHRVMSGADAITSQDIFKMATTSGAKLLNRSDIGSIEIGKAADVIMFDMNQIGYTGAMSDPVAALLFAGFNHTVDTSIINGKIVVRNAQLLSIDIQKLINDGNSRAVALLSRASSNTKINYLKKS